MRMSGVEHETHATSSLAAVEVCNVKVHANLLSACAGKDEV
jgi:hypothetical protein